MPSITLSNIYDALEVELNPKVAFGEHKLEFKIAGITYIQEKLPAKDVYNLLRDEGIKELEKGLVEEMGDFIENQGCPAGTDRN